MQPGGESERSKGAEGRLRWAGSAIDSEKKPIGQVHGISKCEWREREFVVCSFGFRSRCPSKARPKCWTDWRAVEMPIGNWQSLDVVISDAVRWFDGFKDLNERRTGEQQGNRNPKSAQTSRILRGVMEELDQKERLFGTGMVLALGLVRSRPPYSHGHYCGLWFECSNEVDSGTTGATRRNPRSGEWSRAAVEDRGRDQEGLDGFR